jgi:hypothetical protein
VWELTSSPSIPREFSDVVACKWSLAARFSKNFATSSRVMAHWFPCCEHFSLQTAHLRCASRPHPSQQCVDSCSLTTGRGTRDLEKHLSENRNRNSAGWRAELQKHEHFWTFLLLVNGNAVNVSFQIKKSRIISRKKHVYFQSTTPKYNENCGASEGLPSLSWSLTGRLINFLSRRWCLCL